ncbi:Uncharacterised protein [Serratia marcescens]|uniref:Uncharacterized protein n=1 Tax=Serratia marcescens TaxID=615 RepID=A0A379YKL5_SERMA|nr:Uncharacterised protein [Serratia marcescens]
MMAAARLGAQEDGAIDIAIGNLEIQQLAIETLGRRQVVNEEHYVADVDRLRLRIDRAGLIDAAHVAPLVDRRDRHLDRLLAADDEAQRHAVGIAAFQLFSHLTEAGHQRQTRLQARQFGGRGHAPCHAAQGGTAFKRRRQRRALQRVQNDPRPAQGSEFALRFAPMLRGGLQAKVLHEFFAGWQIFDAKLQFFDSDYAHCSASRSRCIRFSGMTEPRPLFAVGLIPA